MSTINTKVFKYNPSVDEVPSYGEYEVPWRQDITVLEVLRYIHEEFEPTSFDYSCRGASCGLCAMKVNGAPVFACATVAKENEDLLIEPLDRFPVIRDLFIDKSSVKDRMLTTQPGFLRETPMENPFVMNTESYVSTGVLQECRECMICQSICPTVESVGFNKYAGPFIMTRLASRYFDEREGQQELRLKTAVKEGLFNCILCGNCTKVCPKGEALKVEGYDYSFIDHVKFFSKMREDAEAAGLVPTPEVAIHPITEEGYTPSLP